MPLIFALGTHVRIHVLKIYIHRIRHSDFILKLCIKTMTLNWGDQYTTTPLFQEHNGVKMLEHWYSWNNLELKNFHHDDTWWNLWLNFHEITPFCFKLRMLTVESPQTVLLPYFDIKNFKCTWVVAFRNTWITASFKKTIEYTKWLCNEKYWHLKTYNFD